MMNTLTAEVYRMPGDIGEGLLNVFEERAEFLSRRELDEWTATASGDRLILGKLVGPGAKLLTGPRGSGKSTFLRRAYYSLLDTQAAFPVYVNYAKSLALEPLFHERANALALFRHWVLLKIAIAATETYEDLPGGTAPAELKAIAAYGRSLVGSLETGSKPDLIKVPVALSALVELLEAAADSIGARRTVLLLDDAAHAFSPEQQHEFFEIFRQLRTRRIAPKAAVYPGVTSYSPFFQVGHEAELVEAWFRPDEDEYVPVMRELVAKRLPAAMSARLTERPEHLDLLAYAAFGIPRGFLNMVSQVLGVDNDKPTAPSRQAVLRAVTDHAETTGRVFTALSAKLPRFKHFIEVGEEILRAGVQSIQAYNGDKSLSSKAVTLALSEPVPSEVERITQLLEYAGVFRRQDSVSRGEKGVFRRLSVHYAFLITGNAFSLGKSYSLSDLVRALGSRDPHEFVRRSPENLAGKDYQARCKLDLPACRSCGAARVNERQRFCMNCGTELSRASVYSELLEAPIELLPITAAKIAGIRQHTALRTVQDILSDDENQLLNVPYIGPVWHARIKRCADEYVSV